MLIKSRMGISADGFVSTPAGVPAVAIAPGFEPGVSRLSVAARPSGGDVHLVGGPRTIRAFSSGRGPLRCCHRPDVPGRLGRARYAPA